MCYVDLVVKKGNSFLMVKRAENPVKGKWWFPGGRLLFNEKLREVVKRKLKEEVNIRNFGRSKFLGAKELSFKKGIFKKPIYGVANVFLVEVAEKDCRNIQVDKTSVNYKWFKEIESGFHPYLKEFLRLAGFKH